jgi:hypothetical protein
MRAGEFVIRSFQVAKASKYLEGMQRQSGVAKLRKERRKKGSRMLDRGMLHAVFRRCLFSCRDMFLDVDFPVGSERTSVVPLPAKQIV